MTDKELIARLRKRASDDRKIQANNEVIAAALRGQRILFDEGHRSDTNTFAVRMALNHENCAKSDAKLAADWDTAADRIEALTKERDHAWKMVAEADARLGQSLGGNLLDKRKLAKAVEALDYCINAPFSGWTIAQGYALATLAEIKGESHE